MKNSPTGFTMIKKEAVMKKIFALFLINLFAIPTFGACSIDLDKPCTATTKDNLNISKSITKNDLKKDNYQNTDIKNQNDDSDCQFGVCFPQKTEEINMPDKQFKHY